MGNHTYYTYIMTNKTKTTLYVGVTNDLFGRVKQHKDKINKGFTQHLLLGQKKYQYSTPEKVLGLPINTI